MVDFPSLQPQGEPPKEVQVGLGLAPAVAAPVAEKKTAAPGRGIRGGLVVFLALVAVGLLSYRSIATYLLIRHPAAVDALGVRPWLSRLAPNAAAPLPTLPASRFREGDAMFRGDEARRLFALSAYYRAQLPQVKGLDPVYLQLVSTALDRIDGLIRIGEFQTAQRELNKVQAALPRVPQPLDIAAAPIPIDVPAPPREKIDWSGGGSAPANLRSSRKAARGAARRRRKTIRRRRRTKRRAE